MKQKLVFSALLILPAVALPAQAGTPTYTPSSTSTPAPSPSPTPPSCSSTTYNSYCPPPPPACTSCNYSDSYSPCQTQAETVATLSEKVSLDIASISSDNGNIEFDSAQISALTDAIDRIKKAIDHDLNEINGINNIKCLDSYVTSAIDEEIAFYAPSGTSTCIANNWQIEKSYLEYIGSSYKKDLAPTNQTHRGENACNIYEQLPGPTAASFYQYASTATSTACGVLYAPLTISRITYKLVPNYGQCRESNKLIRAMLMDEVHSKEDDLETFEEELESANQSLIFNQNSLAIHQGNLLNDYPALEHAFESLRSCEEDSFPKLTDGTIEKRCGCE